MTNSKTPGKNTPQLKGVFLGLWRSGLDDSLHFHFGGLFMAEHELKDATGKVQDATRLAASQHLHLGTRLNAHRIETAAESRMIG